MLKKRFMVVLFTTVLLTGCIEAEETSTKESDIAVAQEETVEKTDAKNEEVIGTSSGETEAPDETDGVEETATSDEADLAEETEEEVVEEESNLFEGYDLIVVDGGDTSGIRQPNVVVDIGFGDREYWAFTNEYGQLVRVIASEIILQDSSEPLTSSGRYYSDEAKVPGVEHENLDEGHVIADSLGGVSNAYNITPQESTLNRHGDQAYMERVIRDAGGASNFEVNITYSDTQTHIPSSYQYTYTLMGNEIVDVFENVNPDEVNEELGLTEDAPSDSTENDVSSVDTNGNGQVTIKEAKAAGYKMPITSDHWLYPYMDDRDGDGMVGE
ncbi:hypothetical protein C772_02266 [Bhargavaea cecembensis DSE10]|uniref:Type VII secretion system protein EssD-like domain-containing protein n=1 Tax=Bhargavaea cecembensis DSE10 TaxID=1235279 RepID=M7NB61_9BACL|nr:DNA/RNA non-specific endonuclease [Bhargavaea cecembensis]EMR05778.1 hypothetical protein C772_02266 [Bhargavaea cecembensis DSE10]